MNVLTERTAVQTQRDNVTVHPFMSIVTVTMRVLGIFFEGSRQIASLKLNLNSYLYTATSTSTDRKIWLLIFLLC